MNCVGAKKQIPRTHSCEVITAQILHWDEEGESRQLVWLRQKGNERKTAYSKHSCELARSLTKRDLALG
jgi:hypothetical protein